MIRNVRKKESVCLSDIYIYIYIYIYGPKVVDYFGTSILVTSCCVSVNVVKMVN